MSKRLTQPDRFEDVIRRLRCIEGHVRGVARMVESGNECPSILRQFRALNCALEKVSKIVLVEHLNNCIPNELQIDDCEGLEKALDEVSFLLLETRRA